MFYNIHVLSPVIDASNHLPHSHEDCVLKLPIRLPKMRNGILVASQCILRRRQWHPTPVLLPGKSHGWRSLVGCSPWCRKESDTTERLHFHISLSCIGEGNGNPLQCSCLENPRDGGAWWAAYMGSHRVGQDWSDLEAAAAAMYFNSISLWSEVEYLSLMFKRQIFIFISVNCCLYPLSTFDVMHVEGCWTFSYWFMEALYILRKMSHLSDMWIALFFFPKMFLSFDSAYDALPSLTFFFVVELISVFFSGFWILYHT